MLGLQAVSLGQQRELWNTQVRLQHTEILFRELDFYNTAFASLSTAAALLAGFAFSGLALALDESVTGLSATLALLCVITTAINLVALCAATFAAIFSVRLALRGTQGEDNVEQAVRQAREECASRHAAVTLYGAHVVSLSPPTNPPLPAAADRLVLRIFVAGIVFFFLSLGAAGFLQLGPIAASAGLLISVAGLAVVLFLFSRIDTRFNLKARATATLTAFHLRSRAEAAGMPAAHWLGSPGEHASSVCTGSLLESIYHHMPSEGYPDESASMLAASEGSERRWGCEEAGIRGPLLGARGQDAGGRWEARSQAGAKSAAGALQPAAGYRSGGGSDAGRRDSTSAASRISCAQSSASPAADARSLDRIESGAIFPPMAALGADGGGGGGGRDSRVDGVDAAPDAKPHPPDPHRRRAKVGSTAGVCVTQ